jgi:hypothetical protein
MECESTFGRIGRDVSLINLAQVIAMPLLYRRPTVHLAPKMTDVYSLASALAASEAGGRSMWPFIRALSIHEPEGIRPPGSMAYLNLSNHLTALWSLLKRCSSLESLHIHYTSDTIAKVCVQALECSTSLLHLDVHDPRRSSLTPIGQLVELRSLRITTWSCGADVLPSKADAWTLPHLQELRWEESQVYLVDGDLHTIGFLAACRFPQLRLVELCVEAGVAGGPQLLSQFLRAHTGIEDLDLVMNAEIYNEAAAVSKTKITRLSFRRCGGVTSRLVHWLPPSLQRLDLPVFPDDGPDTEVCAVLNALQTYANDKLQEVHLTSGLSNGRSRGPFCFDRSTPEVTGITTSQHREIQEYSAKLGALGIKVYDEHGMTVANHKL